MRERNTALAAELGWSDAMTFVAGDIIDAPAGTTTATACRRRARAARLRHRHRRRTGPGRPVGGPGRARIAVLPPRPAAADVGRGRAPAVRAGGPARHPARAARRRAHRRGPGRAAAPGRLPGRGRAVRVGRVHPAQHDDPRGPHGGRRSPTPGPTPSTTRWSPTGASPRTCRPCSPTTLPLVASAVAAVAGLLLATTPGAAAGRADAAGPGADRVQRAGRVGRAPRRAVDAQRRRLGRPGPGRRPARLDGRDRDARRHRPLRPRGARSRHRRPAAGRRSSSATSATTGASRPDVSVFRFREPTRLADATVAPRAGTGSPTPTARTTPRRCSSTPTAGSWWPPRSSPGPRSTGRRASWSPRRTGTNRPDPAGRRAGAGHRRRVPAGRPVRAAHLHLGLRLRPARPRGRPRACCRRSRRGSRSPPTATGCSSAARARSRQVLAVPVPGGPSPTASAARRQPRRRPPRRRPPRRSGGGTSTATWALRAVGLAVLIGGLVVVVARRRQATGSIR